MYTKFPLLFTPLLLLSLLLPAQTTKDATLAVTASFTTNPAGVTLSWPNATASSLIVYRHSKTSPNNLWFTLLNVTNSTQKTLVDNLVSPGQIYEYVVQRVSGNVISYGYAHVALNAPVIDNRGKLLFFVDSTLMGPLADEVGQLKLDMMGDGWTVVPHIIGSGATVQSMKNQIVADYNADPGNVKMVFLLGALPVPYSGNTAWDGHPDHQGAWPADSYYADINGLWTDVGINNTVASRAANDNVPGDGKFDQSYIPGNVELAVGRVDFRHLSPATFGASQVELYRRYLHKDHAWRLHEYTVENKVLIDDNFGYFNGEAFAANGFRNAYPLVGAANVVEDDFFTGSVTNSYMMGMGCGGGTYNSAGGIGNSAQFGTDSVNIVFSMLFGSYHGDWDYETDPFMPSALASKGGILTCSWAGRPHVFYQALASGETIGYCTQETQNAATNTGFQPTFGESGAHVSLLGDPSLRAHVVAPAKDLVAMPQCSSVGLSWTASSGAVGGYHVYRSLVRNGNYTRLTELPITATTYTDLTAPDDTVFYQVRAVQAVSTPGGGTYFNTSTGAGAFLVFAQGTAPEINAIGGLITCSQPAINLTVTSDLPISGLPGWQGPGGLTYAGATVLVNTPGQYTVTVTATNGCTATDVLVVSGNTTAPTFSGSGGTLTCLNPTVTLGAGVLNGSVSWTGPNGFTSTQLNPTVMVAGQYLATITSAANGCTRTGTVNVQIDTFLPTLTLPTIPTLTCTTLCIDVVLPPIPGHQIYVDGTLIPAGSPLGLCTPGAHTLSLRSVNNGCQDNYPIVVNQNITPPGAVATGGTIGCGTSLQLQGSSPTPNMVYQWSGPGGFNSILQNPMVTATGNYTLIVSNPVNGCTSTAIAMVNNPSAPNVSATGLMLDCITTTGTLQGNSTTPGVSYSWTGPNGYTSNQQNPAPSQGGLYTLVVTAPNGCTSSATAELSVNADLPSANALGATLTCSQPTVVLQGFTSTVGATYSWTGPNGFTSTLQNPEVNTPGIYTWEVTGPNGCSATATAEVSIALPLQFAPISAGNVDCDGNATFTAEVSGGTLPYSYAWSTGDSTASILVPPGTATMVSVTVQDAAGCTVSIPAVTVTSFTPVEVSASIVNETGTQQNGSIILFVGFGNCQNPTYLWSNGATTSALVGLSADLYTATVTCPATGCSTTITVEVGSIVGTEDPAFWKKLALSPNPASEQAFLQVQFPVATAFQVKMLDATGRAVLILPETTLIEGTLPLDLRLCPPGMYMVHVATKTGTAVRKLVVERN